MNIKRNIFAVLACAVAFISPVSAQQPGSGAQPGTGADVVGNGLGHIIITGASFPTTVSNVTLADGSSDVIGTFVATNTSGSITFGFPYNRVPFCTVDSTTAANPVYNITSQQIVLTTIVSGTSYTYFCVARPGG